MDEVAAHSREWVQQVRLVVDDSDLRRHDRHGMSLFACMNYPEATREGLNLIGDWVSWWAIWSDYPDDPEFLHQSGRAEAFFASLTGVLTGSTNNRNDPHIAAFTDLWHRWCLGMSPHFIARTRSNWADWFDSYRTRCKQRRVGHTLGVDAYLALRDLTGAVRLEMDAVERVGGYEVPAALLECDPLRAMRLCTTRVVCITQDVQSLAKEEAAGDQHNFVLALEHQDGLTREQALRRAHACVRNYTDSFLARESGLPRFLDAQSVPVENRAPIYRYAHDLRSLMRGGYEFCSVSQRYQ
ncbi:terpene synthase family protein [Streptomyces sp. TR02-1]|uniref:terpene synthase family protein n=1 Tax=Streptomyces sp. TR02-1 TaxID=3385977 RepID=UPI00399F4C8F